MCGRFSLTMSPKDIQEEFGLAEEPSIEPRNNIAPGQEIPAIGWDRKTGGRKLAMLKWGFVPHWAKDPKKLGTSLINARIETASEKPSFRESFKSRRILIPADAFYEWKTEGKTKSPFRIAPKGGGLFAMAGIWDHWSNREGLSINTCAILTVPAIHPIDSLHDRMPLVIPKEAFADWIFPDQAWAPSEHTIPPTRWSLEEFKF